MPFKRYLQHPAARPVALLVAVLLVVAVVFGVRHFSKPPSPFATINACDILTADIAHQVGGNSLIQEPIKPQTTGDSVTTYCVYRGASSSVALVIRSPKDQQGITLNHDAFSSMPSGSQAVRGYGDEAYWAPNFAQFNILSHDRWYILSSGPNVATQRTMQQSKILADKIVTQL